MRVKYATVPDASMRILWSLVVCLVAPGVASAQICRGTADVTDQSRFQGGVLLDTSEDSSGASAALSAGGDYYFAEGEVGYIGLKDPDAPGFQSRVFIGGQVPLASNRRLILCPGVSIANFYIPDIDGIDVRLFGVGGALAVGFVAEYSPAFKVVPALGILVERQRRRFSNEFFSQAIADTLGSVEFGVGFLIRDRIAIKPSFLVPFLDDDASSHVRLTMTILTGR
jgi:hypothetical protein